MQNSFRDGEVAADVERDSSAATTNASARLLTPDCDEYPARLRDLKDPPPRLWAQGTLPMAAPPAVAIVGTRRATAYGLRTAHAISAACARAGVTVISGLARGIDGAAHKAALDARGRTVAVLGTGLNLCYPREHRLLQAQIGNEGLLLTEHEAASSGHRGAFPRRNRIIAALADVVVVVEAGQGSGALITSDCAVTLGRTVAVVPGNIDSLASAGSNVLLRGEATPVLSPSSVLELFAIDASPPVLPALDGNAAFCWDALQQGASELSHIAQLAGISSRAAAAAISALEVEGLVAIDAGGRIRSTLERFAQ